MKPTLIAVLCLLTLCGCDQPQKTVTQPPPVAPPATVAATAQPVEAFKPELFELPTDALPRWRRFSDLKPTLVLFSYDPFLQPIPKELQSAAVALARNGSAAEIAARGRIFRADPALLPTQTLSAALEAGFFSRFCWVFPSTVTPEQLTLELFRKQMTEARFFTPDEAAKLELADGIYRGTLRGLPFQAIHPWALPKLEGPLLLHVDLSYFRGLYKDSVTTPVYELLHQTASALRDSGWKPEAVTLSYSTEEGGVALASRFLMRNLATVLKQPAMLDNEPPALWNLRAEALQGIGPVEPEKQLELARKEVAAAPQDPSAQYDLFSALLAAKQLKPALAALDQAVAGDPGYGYAYAELAQQAVKERSVPAALSLLEKAAKTFPENPFIPLQLGDVLISIGEPQQALERLAPLKSLNWSRLYHAEVPQMLAGMEKEALALQAKSKK